MSASAQYQGVHFLGGCREKILKAVKKKILYELNIYGLQEGWSESLGLAYANYYISDG